MVNNGQQRSLLSKMVKNDQKKVKNSQKGQKQSYRQYRTKTVMVKTVNIGHCSQKGSKTVIKLLKTVQNTFF